MALRTLGQDDFSAGMVRGIARHLMPSNSAYTITDALLDDDGAIYRRGGSVYKSSSAFAGALRFLWDGYLPAVGLRTLVGYSTAFGILSPSDDATVVAMAGGGVSEPKVAVQVADVLMIGGGTIYAGSQKSASYSTGTVTTTLNSATVTGAGGTLWSANVDAGMLIEISGDTQRFYVVKSVDSNTQITLTEPYIGTAAAGQTYVASAFKTAPATTPSSTTRGFLAADFYAVVAGRLLAAIGNRLYMSKAINPANGRSRWQEWNTYDFHDFPEGTQIVGVFAVRDRALVFTTGGVWVLSGLALEIVDAAGNPQHRKEQISSDIVLWGAPGVAQVANTLVVPATDGVYLMDGISPPVQLTQSIARFYRDYVRGSNKPGGATVYRSHLFLPVLSSANAVVEHLVCRLDRPVKTRQGQVFPWTRLAGHGGNVTALASRAVTGANRAPKLLGAGADSRCLDLSSFFEPSAAVKNDADATTHKLIVETRDFRTGRQGVQNTVTRARLRYVLLDAASDNPGVIFYYSTGKLQGDAAVWGTGVWGSFTWADSALGEYVLAAGVAPEDDGREPYTWASFSARAEFVRFRIESSGPCATFTVRELELAVRDNNLSW